MRVLVCGGRNYNDWRRVYDEMDAINSATPIEAVITGAASGVDGIALDWAKSRLIKCLPFPADWKKHGRAAGPIRNQQMLDEGLPALVVAFPGGRGTADMIGRAIGANIPVRKIALR